MPTLWERQTSTASARRFWAIATAGVAVGPFLAWQETTQPSALAIAAISIASLVVLTWMSEACRVEGWPVRLITFAVGGSTSAALLPWNGSLIAWLVVLAFAAIAIEDSKPDDVAPPLSNTDAQSESDIPNVSGALNKEAAEEEDDPSVIASLVRRIENGIETVEGLVRAEADRPTHIVFHPPMSNTPEVELYDVDSCEPRLAEATPYGFRVTTKTGGRIAFSAAAPAA